MVKKGSDVSVIILGRLPHLLSPKPEFDFKRVVKKISEFKPHGESADYVAGMDLAMQTLARTKNPLRRLYILSDNQAHGWWERRSGKWAYHHENLSWL